MTCRAQLITSDVTWLSPALHDETLLHVDGQLSLDKNFVWRLRETLQLDEDGFTAGLLRRSPIWHPLLMPTQVFEVVTDWRRSSFPQYSRSKLAFVCNVIYMFALQELLNNQVTWHVVSKPLISSSSSATPLLVADYNVEHGE